MGVAVICLVFAFTAFWMGETDSPFIKKFEDSEDSDFSVRK